MAGLYFDSGIDKGFEKDLARMNAKLNRLSGNVQKQSKVMDSAFKDVTRTVGGLVSVMAIGAAGKELINFSKDLETALTEVGTISKEVSDNFDQYKTAILGLSTQTDASAKTLTNAYYDIVSAGYDGQQGLELLKASQEAGVAGFVDVGVAADGLTTVLNAWGKSADQAAQVSDVFFKTVEKGKTTFPELASNISQVAPLASSLGISFEEVSASIATLTKQGTPTAQAFTQVRSAMVAMNEQLGASYFETHTLQQGFQALLDKSKETGQTLQQVTGRVEGAMAVLATTGNNAKVAADDLNAMNEALGATASAAEKVKATTEEQIKILKNNILAALEPLGTDISKIIGDIALKLNKAFESGKIQEYAKIILQLAKVFATYKIATLAQNQVDKISASLLLQKIKLTEQMRLEYALSGNQASASALKMAVANKVLTNSFKALTTAFKANPIGFLVTGIIAALPLIQRLINKNKDVASSVEKVKSASEKLTDSIAEETSGMNDLFDRLKQTNEGSETRKTLIEEINQKYGSYLPNLLTEKSSLDDITIAQNSANEALINNIALKAENEERSKILEEQIKREQKAFKQLSDFTNMSVAEIGSAYKDFLNTGDLDVFYEKGADGLYRLGQNGKYASDIFKELSDARNEDSNSLQNINDLYSTYITQLKKVSTVQTQGIQTPEQKNETDLKKLEIYYQSYINFIESTYSDEEKYQKIKNTELLKAELEYLKKKRKLTKDKLEKIKIDAQIIEDEKKLKEVQTQKDTTGKTLNEIEIRHQKIINELTKQYGGEKDLQKKLHDELIKEDIRYLQEKLKLTDDEFEKLKIEYQILQDQLNLGGDGTTKEKDVTGSLSQITNALSDSGNKITSEIANLTDGVVKAFDTINNNSSSTADKISGIVSLITAVGKMLKENVMSWLNKEVDQQVQITKEVAARVSFEKTINDILYKRQELQLNQSAFLNPNYIDQYNLALQSLSDSESELNNALDGLNKNLILTAEGTGESFLGINKDTEQFSFTIDQIINGSKKLEGLQYGKYISAFTLGDVLDIFGSGAATDAQLDAYNKVVAGFNDALKSMGKTAGDMANFSSEQWTEFYTILDDGGYIADQGTKQLVESMKAAQEQYTQALETMKGIISDIAGSLGDALSDSIVNAVANGTDALDEFKSSLNDVFLEMAKAEMNKLFFQGLFDQLQQEMQASMQGGDQNWQDDLLRFYDQLPDAISGAEDFMSSFNDQLKQMGFNGLDSTNDISQSTSGAIKGITEQTADILAGHFGAIRLSNERIANYSEEMLDLGVQNLVTLNKIKENTDYLPQIAENTKKTAQKLGGY